MGAGWISFKALLWREMLRNFRVWTQTFLPPLISSSLYVLVFGKFIGDRIGEVGGLSYMEFLIPGLIMMQVIFGTYGSASFTVFFSKWEKTIHDVLTSPISYIQMVLAILFGAGVIRGVLVAMLLVVLFTLFGITSIASPLITLYYLVMVGLIFSAGGMMAGLWADRFDQFNIIQTFILTPLIYLGGVFYSIETLPPLFQKISAYNPLLYMINGLRYGMTGFSDTNIWLNAGIVTGAAVIMVTLCVLLFRSGYKMRT